MSEDKDSEDGRPPTEEEVIEMAGAETEEEKSLAIAQAKLIGDL